MELSGYSVEHMEVMMNYFNLLWNLYQLKRNTGMRREQLITLQEKKLRELLVYAYDNSTYYHRVFEEAGITRKQIPLMPLSAFPVLNKQLLMEHFNELVTVSDLKQEDLRRFDREESTEQKKFKDEYHVVHSSGSTGTPGYFVYDEAAWSQMLLGIIRAALWDMTMPQILKLLERPADRVYCRNRRPVWRGHGSGGRDRRRPCGPTFPGCQDTPCSMDSPD